MLVPALSSVNPGVKDTACYALTTSLREGGGMKGFRKTVLSSLAQVFFGKDGDDKIVLEGEVTIFVFACNIDVPTFVETGEDVQLFARLLVPSLVPLKASPSLVGNGQL